MKFSVSELCFMRLLLLICLILSVFPFAKSDFDCSGGMIPGLVVNILFSGQVSVSDWNASEAVRFSVVEAVLNLLERIGIKLSVS